MVTHPLNPPPLIKGGGLSILRRGASPLLNTPIYEQVASLHNLYGENCGIIQVGQVGGEIMIEYGVMVGSAELKPAIMMATSDQVAQTITTILNHELQKVKKALNSFQGGGWEIISHELTRIDSHVAVSFLVRREK